MITRTNFHGQILQESDVKIEDKSEISSQSNEEFDDYNNFEDSKENFKMQEYIKTNKLLDHSYVIIQY